MPVDPKLERQLRTNEDMIRSLRRKIDSLNQQVRLLQRQEGDSKRLPNADRERAKIRGQIREAERSTDRAKSDARALERQRDDLKRMMR